MATFEWKSSKLEGFESKSGKLESFEGKWGKQNSNKLDSFEEEMTR